MTKLANLQAACGATGTLSFFQLFRYATGFERFLMAVAIFLASLASTVIPYTIAIYGEFTSLLIDRTVRVGTSSPTYMLQLLGGGRTLTDASVAANNAALMDDAFAFGAGSFVSAIFLLILISISISIANEVARRQIGRIRVLLLQSILRQEISWYDTNSSYNFASKITEDLDKIKEGIGEKVVIFTYLTMTFAACIALSLFYGLKLTLVVLLCCPFIILSTALVAKVQSSLAAKELGAYSAAGAIAEEVFAGIRTVFAFSGEQKEVRRFTARLKPAEAIGRLKGLYSGVGSGTMWFIIYCCYALSISYGAKLILDDRAQLVREYAYTPGVVVVVLFGVIMGAQNLGFSSPHIEAFATAKGAAANIFSIIMRSSKIDPVGNSGMKPTAVAGNIRFEGLRFHYPARPDVEILKGFTLDVPAGKTVALVGASGCGKSTTIQLMQRFYDPLAGSVQLDGHDLRTLNVSWLREQIGVVGQEPALFATTIGENIGYGNSGATQADIEQAARMANCHDFISKLPSGYETLVGERGSQLSGGQKQRVAIARALVRNPKILLLDEATSALDPTAEKHVQDALEIASQGRTTLVVSHRLSTITNADKIVFVQNGQVAEQGTHEELMALNGLYCQLVQSNQRKEIYSTLTDVPTNEERKEICADDEAAVSDNGKAEDGVAALPEDDATDSKSAQGKASLSWCKLIMMNAPEWHYITFGGLAAVIHGATYPIWGVFFGSFFTVLSSNDPEFIWSEAKFFAAVFIGIGVITAAATSAQTYLLTLAGAKMTTRLRQTAFTTILQQPTKYFDDKNNSVGSLCARLATDCSNVQGATGIRIGIIVQAASTLAVGLCLALFFSWKLTLVTASTIPLICFAIAFESQFSKKSDAAEKASIERASQIAVEAISNIRTIANLGLEGNVLKRYCCQVEIANAECRTKSRLRGLVFGLGQAAPAWAYGLALYYGGVLVASQGLAYDNVIKVSEALLFGSWMLGQALAYAPNVSAAILSAGRLQELFDSAPSGGSQRNKLHNAAAEAEEEIDYRNVDFEYPTRRGFPIVRKLNLTIRPGTTVALVGPSGSGKSTCVELLLRFYEPDAGTINLNGVPTTELSLSELRSRLGLVSQEPVLFDCTIAENIAYGNNLRDDIPTQEIIDAAKKANIHNFITTLPQGYETRLGSKGAQLSGGQKQRVAIARALIRDPKILILDEATSALDLESEKIVQQALDAARSGRTCITIAHRLTTVRDADLICVLKKGVIVEQGTHSELMAGNGLYAELYQMQQVGA